MQSRQVRVAIGVTPPPARSSCLVNRTFGANRGSGGDRAGSCWSSASMNGHTGRCGHGEGGSENLAGSYCVLWCD